VADYRDIDAMFGSMADADVLIAEAHAHGLRIIPDIVPNHTSDQHAWFHEALAAGPGSAARDRYIFRPGRGGDGSEPPKQLAVTLRGRGERTSDVGAVQPRRRPASEPLRPSAHVLERRARLRRGGADRPRDGQATGQRHC
jgi:hypothetical protein